MILSTLDKSRKGGAYEQIPSLVLGQRWTPQLNSRNMMKVVLCVWIEPYIENDLSFCVWPVHTPTTSKEVLTLSASTSPLPYTGNKSCIVNTILSVMPKHTVYIDPCMGSAEVFFRKPRAEKEILNDYNGDLVNLFRVIQNNEKLAYLLGRLYLSINGELAFKQNKDRLKGVPNILDDVIETSQIFYDASWEDIQNAAAFLENQVYSFSSTGQTFGIARRDMSQRLPRLMSAYNRIRDAIILHRDYKDVITYAACPGSFIAKPIKYDKEHDLIGCKKSRCLSPDLRRIFGHGGRGHLLYGRTCNPGQRRSQAQISSMKPLLRHGQLTAQQNIKGRMPCIYFGLNLFCSQVAMRPPCVAIIERAKCLKLLI